MSIQVFLSSTDVILIETVILVCLIPLQVSQVKTGISSPIVPVVEDFQEFVFTIIYLRKEPSPSHYLNKESAIAKMLCFGINGSVNSSM